MKRLLFWNGRGNHNVLEVFLSGMSDTYSINFFRLSMTSVNPCSFPVPSGTNGSNIINMICGAELVWAHQ